MNNDLLNTGKQHPVDRKKAFNVMPLRVQTNSGRSQIEQCRKEELAKINGFISGVDSAGVIETVARSGNTSMINYLVLSGTENGQQIVCLSAEDSPSRLKEELRHIVTDNETVTILLDESPHLLNWEEELKRTPDKNDRAARDSQTEIKNFFEYLKELISQKKVKIILLAHAGMDEQGNTTGDEMVKWGQSRLIDGESTIPKTNLEVMSKEGLALLFEMHPERENFPPELISAKEDIVAYVWGPMQLNAYLDKYLEKRDQGETDQQSAEFARSFIINQNEIWDVIRTTAGLRSNEILQLMVKAGLGGISMETLTEEEKKTLNALQFAHLFETKDGMVRVGAGCLYDYAKVKTETEKTRRQQMEALDSKFQKI